MATDYSGAGFGAELPMTGAELPSPATLLRAFREPATADRPDSEVLDAAHELVQCHERRHHAQRAAHAVGATPRRVAECSQLMEDIDDRREELVDRIDDWVAAHIAHRSGASIHTETLGAVIDRMVAKWVVAQQALGMPPSSTRPSKNGDGRARRHTGPQHSDRPPNRNGDEIHRNSNGTAANTGIGEGDVHHGVDREAHLQWYRLAEMVDGYRDLITEVAQHRRRLPVW